MRDNTRRDAPFLFHTTYLRLFAKILQRDLDALIVHLLEIGLELVTTFGAAREELDDMRDRCAILPLERLDPCRRTDVNEAIEVVVDHVVKQCVDVDAARRLVPDAKHLGAIARRSNMLIAPPTFFEFEAP